MPITPTPTFKPGQSIRFTVTDKVVGVLTTPATMTLTVKPPGAAAVTPTVVQDSNGIYHADYAIPMIGPIGVWYWRWQSTGSSAALAGLVEDSFNVAQLDF